MRGPRTLTLERFAVFAVVFVVVVVVAGRERGASITSRYRSIA